MTPAQLTALRQCLAWSKSRLARELSVTASTVCRWESGQVPIPDSQAKLIGLVCGLIR